MDGTNFICLHAIHGRVPWRVLEGKRKEKNWAALCHGRHAFRLHMPFMAECHGEFWKEKEKNWAALCHGQHAYRLHMPFMAECHGEFWKEKEKNWAALCHGWHAFRLRLPFMVQGNTHNVYL